MAGLGGIFGEGTTANQLLVWGVLNQLLSAAMAPGVTEVTKLVNEAAPLTPLDPNTAAAATARTLADPDAMTAYARQAGLPADVFATMVEVARQAPDLSMVLTALNRQLIPAGGEDPDTVSARGALADSGIRPEWHDTILALRQEVPSVAEVMNAWLQGQITEGEAHARYLAAGGLPDWFQTAYNANGQAPTPVEALEMLNRGIIARDGTGPASTSYRQAFLEGPWRNKWEPAFEKLGEYLPPPRTITAMFHDGQLNRDDALGYLVAQGLTPTLAAAYLSPTASHKTTETKTLAKSDLMALVRDKLISDDEAVKGLVALHYTEHDAKLEVQLNHMRAAAAAMQSAVSRTRSLFLAGTITAAEARATLPKLGVPADQVSGILATWHLVDKQAPRQLTAAQIESAWYYDLLTTTEALHRLEALGYSDADALLALSVRNRGKLTPAQMAGGADSQAHEATP